MEVIDRLAWLRVGLGMGVRETIRLCLAYFGEFGSEPKSEKVNDCQISRFSEQRKGDTLIRGVECVWGK